MHPLLRHLLPAVLVAAVCAPAVWAQPAVWTAAEAPPPGVRLHPESGTERPGGRASTPHYVRLDRAVLSAAVAEARQGGSPSLSFEVAPGVRVRSEAVWTERRGPDRLTWSGTVAGVPLGHVLLTVEGEAAVGHVTTSGQSYAVGYAEGGRQVIYEVDPAALGVPCHVVEGDDGGGLFGGAEGLGEWRQERNTGAPDTVRVLMLYTSAVREAIGGAGVAALLQGSVDSANDVLIRSEVTGRIAMAHAREVPTPDSALVQDAVDALDYLREPGDGVFDGVHTWRLEHGAPLVSLITELPTFCGVAYIPPVLARDTVLRVGFSVVRRSCAIANQAFAHEVGHNLGLLHDPYIELSHRPFPFGHGYVSLVGAPGEQFRTVMAYAVECAENGVECPRVPYFSNASLALGEHPLGEPELSDAARALSISMPFIAGLLPDTVIVNTPDLYLVTAEDEPVFFIPSSEADELRLVVPPRHGEVTVQNDTMMVYQPHPGYFGADSLIYEAFRTYGGSSVGRVFIEVEEIPSGPHESSVIVPANNIYIDLNEMEEPLEIQWTELGHPDFPNGGASLEATWHLRVLHIQQRTFEIYAGDTTRLQVSAETLDEMMAAVGILPGISRRVDHWVVVSDGELSTRGPWRQLTLRRLVQADPPDDGGDDEEDELLPLAPTLRAAYPNPAREILTLEVGVPSAGAARVTVYDVMGRPVRTVEAALEVGVNRLRLEVRSLPSGVYFYRVEAGGEAFRGRVTVL